MDQNPYETGQSNVSDKAKENSSTFKKILKGFMIFSSVLVGLIILMFIWVAFQTSTTYSKFDGKAEPFIRNFLQSQSPWDYEQAKDKLSTVWYESSNEEHDLRLFNHFKKLGTLTEIEDIAWQGCSTYTDPDSGTINRCNYSVTTIYERGDAQVVLGLVMEESNIKIVQLQVNSDVFMQ